MMCQFGSTYVCEQEFSTNVVKLSNSEKMSTFLYYFLLFTNKETKKQLRNEIKTLKNTENSQN